MADVDVEIARAIATTTEELEQARTTVRDLANELSDVIDIIEPALADQVKRLREARMASLMELKNIGGGIRELSELLLSNKTEQMLTVAERFIRVLKEFETCRADGTLGAVVKAFTP